MDTIQVFVLALIQGLTEYLPISSSAHLILPSQLLGWTDQGLAFDVAVHIGSLLAVCTYFRRELQLIISSCWAQLLGGQLNEHSRLGWFLMFGTIPVGLAGLLFDDFIENNLRSIAVIALTTIIFGLLLGLVDKKGTHQLTMEQMSWRSAMLIGLSQALALIPGTSRSGITITAALALGYDRQSAARFSFLLAIPVIILSGGYKGLQLVGEHNTVAWNDIFLGIGLSALTAFACIHFFLALVNRIGMMPFVWYRLALGGYLYTFLMNGS
ncbi:MAG: undecaprenyl-diphosphate phosphatase [Gammaproteobacteria bacterium]|nr:undecaprenyl-diphosphate phosphatase [Gammaproteobacteria bacterium]MBQ0839791.1 undecaprenyl-diphosphate phosphatase [Gammaproteobacteria bacterium]